eukprot:TRINITY_DN109419_c0_g1_i1.p1 TRINITY_DN109419_c0_g1~~TRINITY_DN109419_c0_g1_i1.p1  ORF type:complete len:185 (+),score=20.39 TRINITY_DN109419_c0_g1_i1:42-557(+)
MRRRTRLALVATAGLASFSAPAWTSAQSSSRIMVRDRQPNRRGLLGPARKMSCITAMRCGSEAKAQSKQDTSTLELLRFALPALGISLCGPILSNIDNAFVGRMSGPEALAALSPGTVVADNILYLLVFLPRATLGLVSRAYAAGGASAAQPELVRVLSVALPAGALPSLV